MTPNEVLGWIASGMVFATFCSREMVPLRMLAIGSNLAFAGYGFGAHLWPILVLHSAMLPINIVRLRQSCCPGDSSNP